MDQTRLLGVMERVAHRLRRAGLGPAVSAARRRLETRFVPSWTEVDGLRMTGRTIGHVDHLRAWQRGEEEAQMTAMFKQAVKPGDTVLDVGGYLGWFTLLAARAVGPHGRVIVVEANPQSLELLERNVDRNGFGDRVTIHRTAVADEPGTATFYWDASDGSASGLTPPDNLGGSYEVRLATIDSLLEGAQPDVVKIDIEGGEVRALAGMHETLARAKPGMKLFVELNPGALANAGTSGDALLAELRNAGFRINMIDEAARALQPLAADERLEQHANLYCELAA
jgi:FkbM family methyltransferase